MSYSYVFELYCLYFFRFFTIHRKKCIFNVFQNDYTLDFNTSRY